MGSFPHEEFVLLAPKRGYCEDPPDLGGGHLADLFLEFVESLLADEAKSVLDDRKEGHLASVDGLGSRVHVQQVHLVLHRTALTFWKR